MTKLEYLLIYQPSGLPIWSKCFGNTCMQAMKEPMLLTGFLAALETFSTEIDSDSKLEAIKMGKTIMNFKRTLPSGNSIVIGADKEDIKMVNSVFDALQTLLETNYKDTNFDMLDTEIFSKQFESDLLNNTLLNALHNHGGFTDTCTGGDNCLMKTTPIQAKKRKIWNAIKDTYSKMKEKMNSRS